MTRKILTIALFFTLYITVLHAQKESYNWAFGRGAGLSWNTPQSYTGTAIFGTTGGNITLNNIPSSFTSAVYTSEGCFSVSTAEGALMFYSDGTTVWDKNNNPMPNGTGLRGNASSAQSGIVLPYPGQGGKYIVIAVGFNQANNLSYSVVDMSLNGGLGDVVAGQKNILFTGATGNTGEAVTAVRAANYRDYWIVGVGRTSTATSFNVWKVDLDGVHPAAKTANTVTINLPAFQTVSGYITFNKDGTNFWYNGFSATPATGLSYAFGTFDSTEGKFTTVKTKIAPRGNSYSTAFSPNNRYVYVTHISGNAEAPTAPPYLRTSYLEVYDFQALMSAANPNTVPALKEVTATGRQLTDGSSNSDAIGGVLLGPDGKMYIATAFNNDMYVIPDPNANPTNLKIYKLNNILGYPNYVDWGLPVYAAMYFQLRLTPMSAVVCQKSSAGFRLSITGGEGAEVFSRYTLDWGDGSPVITNTNPQLNSTTDYTHVYNKMGDYTVTFNSYDTNNQIMLGSSSNAPVHVSNCFVPVNPHIRGRMK